ncbi:heparinase II/III domain-containing protein [Crateriforma conspicua]|uniref:heparinase II/III domain-containing protein n=1 Tax=Crateriforma conspicua TaxID=2527996 RepID=UPI00118791D1|nr:heparinase II/III family protein [Crateriforma conspicua]QDV64416.1 Heparin and heparin-sulfate lyase precursor [Crateriforma conspicua]
MSLLPTSNRPTGIFDTSIDARIFRRCRPLAVAMFAWLLLLPGSHLTWAAGPGDVDTAYPPDASIDQVRQLVDSIDPVHPRLFADAEAFSTLKRSIADDPLRKTLADAVIRQADWLADTPPVRRQLEGRRLLDVSRTALKRVLVLATAYQITDNAAYADRCVVEMLAAARFTDWNPSHFLDVGEMTLALAIGYDWCFDAMTDDQRQQIRNAIVEKGVSLPFETNHKGWVRASNNWGQVCHAGLTAGALAVAEDHPELAAKTVKNAIDNVTRSMHVFAPEGCYPEGPGYWAYGTGFNVVLIDALETALGTDFGLSHCPGFDKTGGYLTMVTGPSGETFNYADGGSGRSPQSCLFWFASRFDQPAWLMGETQRIQSYAESVTPRSAASSSNRLLPLALIWQDDTSPGNPADSLPLNWNPGGDVPITVHRSSWDPQRQTFLGIKAGSPSANHGNMDVGSFVLDADTIRWAVDLGAEGYHGIESRGMNLWDRSQNSDRWTIFRQSNAGHNTLVINGQLQRAKGFGTIAKFDAKSATTIVDMSDVYAGQAESVRRGFRMLDDGSVIIRDELSGLKPGDTVRWGMITKAEKADADSTGREMLLRQDGQSLRLTVDGPDDAPWQVIDTATPRSEFDSPNRGTSMVAFESAAGDDGTLAWTVHLAPGSTGNDQTGQGQRRQTSPLDRW